MFIMTRLQNNLVRDAKAEVSSVRGSSKIFIYGLCFIIGIASPLGVMATEVAELNTIDGDYLIYTVVNWTGKEHTRFDHANRLIAFVFELEHRCSAKPAEYQVVPVRWNQYMRNICQIPFDFTAVDEFCVILKSHIYNTADAAKRVGYYAHYNISIVILAPCSEWSETIVPFFDDAGKFTNYTTGLIKKINKARLALDVRHLGVEAVRLAERPISTHAVQTEINEDILSAMNGKNGVILVTETLLYEPKISAEFINNLAKKVRVENIAVSSGHRRLPNKTFLEVYQILKDVYNWNISSIESIASKNLIRMLNVVHNTDI